jgi:hypothetical protein
MRRRAVKGMNRKGWCPQPSSLRQQSSSRIVNGTEADLEHGFQERGAEVKTAELGLDEELRAYESMDILPLAANPVPSERWAQSEPFELELEALRVGPLLATGPQSVEPRLEPPHTDSEASADPAVEIRSRIAPVLESGLEAILPLPQKVILPERESISSEWSGTERVGPASINVAAEFAALASVCEHERDNQQVVEQEQDRSSDQAAHSAAELRASKPSTRCEHTDWQEASKFWGTKEPLLLRDETARKNLPALASANLPSVLLAQIGVLHGQPAIESSACAQEATEAADATEQTFSAIADEQEAREGTVEPEALTIEPLIVRNVSFQNDEAEQRIDAAAEQSEAREEISADTAEAVEATEQAVSVTASEKNAREANLEPEALTIEPLIVRNSSPENEKAEQRTEAAAGQSGAQEEISAERAEAPKELERSPLRGCSK